ncbi:MAG: hypothetical protein WKG07_20300 [Hymenobacter sp.]
MFDDAARLDNQQADASRGEFGRRSDHHTHGGYGNPVPRGRLRAPQLGRRPLLRGPRRARPPAQLLRARP